MSRIPLTADVVAALSPDDASTKAARGLVAPAKWPMLGAGDAAVWGVPSFACTPDAFPGLMAAAIRRDDVGAWVAGQGIKTSRAVG